MEFFVEKIKIAKYGENFEIVLTDNNKNNDSFKITPEALEQLKFSILRMERKSKPKTKSNILSKVVDGERFEILNNVLIYRYKYLYSEEKSPRYIIRKVPMEKLTPRTLLTLPKSILTAIKQYWSFIKNDNKEVSQKKIDQIDYLLNIGSENTNEKILPQESDSNEENYSESIDE